MTERVILVRYGEIGLKGRNRSQFVDQLVRNLRRALAGLGDFRLVATYGRIYIEGESSQLDGEVHRAVARTFGVVSFSPAQRIPADLDAICAAAAEELAAAKRRGPVTTFKIEARRPDKRFPIDSMQLNRQVGAYVAKAHPDVAVDVHRPDVAISVEVRSEGALLSSWVMPGPGGLPVGSSSKALLLLSGGIDSPVAGWLAAKRGIALEAVHFHSFPFTSERSLQKVRDLCRRLALYVGPIPLHVVHFTEVQKALQKGIPDSYGITLMRRFMLRISERVAAQRQALALVTGESVGQVASQTLESMVAINDVTTLPVLRPLVAMDKMEIIERARAIGTYETSILPYEDCCTLFVPERPQTKPRLDAVRRVEVSLDVDSLVDEAVRRTETEMMTS